VSAASGNGVTRRAAKNIKAGAAATAQRLLADGQHTRAVSIQRIRGLLPDAVARLDAVLPSLMAPILAWRAAKAALIAAPADAVEERKRCDAAHIEARAAEGPMLAAHEEVFALVSRISVLNSAQLIAPEFAEARAERLNAQALAAEGDRMAKARAKRQAGMSAATRAKPTNERAARSRVKSVGVAGTVTLADELPMAIARLHKLGKITNAEANAVGRARNDYLYGYSSGAMTTNYGVRVDGGGAGPGDEPERKADARRRWDAALDACGPGLAEVFRDVVVMDVSLDSGPGVAGDHATKPNRRAAASTVLILAVQRVASVYGLSVRTNAA